MNRFEQLLASIPEEHSAGREALKTVGEQHPEVSNLLSQGFLRKDEFSRRMDEVRDKVQYADQHAAWYKDNWVPDAYGEGRGATKSELAKEEELKALREQLANTGGGEVTFEDLNKMLPEAIKAHGIITKPELDAAVEARAKAEGEQISGTLRAYAYAATVLPEVTLRHQQEFGEILDADQFLEAAGKANATDLKKFHGEFVKERRDKLTEEKHQKELEAAEARGREKALLEQVTQPNAGPMPVDLDGDSMGHVQRKLMGGVPKAADGAAAPPADLGQGAIARTAALNADRNEFAKRTS